MEASDFKARQNPWFDIDRWRKWTESHDVTIEEGEHHNRTDGGVHYLLHCDGCVFDFQANYWDYRRGWQGSIDWVESRRSHEEA